MDSRLTRLATPMLLICLAYGVLYLKAQGATDEYNQWILERNRLHYAEMTPDSLMIFLPLTLRDAHARAVAGDRKWFEDAWALGQPEFFVQDVDTLTHGRDTLEAVLFSDGRSSQIVALGIVAGRKRVLPCKEGPFVTGLLAAFRTENVDVDHDGRCDLAVVHGGGAHSSVLRVYLWKGDEVLAVGAFASDTGSQEFRDVDSNGTLEVIVENRTSTGSAKEVFQLIGNSFVKSAILTAALPGEGVADGER